MPPRPATPTIRQPANSVPGGEVGHGPRVRLAPDAEPITFAGGTLDRAADRRTDAAWSRRRAGPARLAVVGGRRGVLLDGDAPGAGRRSTAATGVLLGVRDDGAPLWAVEAARARSSPTCAWPSGALVRRRRRAARLRAVAAALAPHATASAASAGSRRRRARRASCARAPNGHVAPPAHRPRRDHARRRRRPGAARAPAVLAAGPLLARWPASSSRARRSRPPSPARSRRRRGVEVGEVRYRASQPWPFPASLMIGFEADYAGGEATAGDDELEDVALVHARRARREAANADDARVAAAAAADRHRAAARRRVAGRLGCLRSSSCGRRCCTATGSATASRARARPSC